MSRRSGRAGIALAALLPLPLCGQTLQSSVPLDSAAFRIEGSRLNAIARGGVFTIFTSNGPATAVSATTLPLGNSLGGASIRIQVGGETCDAPMLVASRTQVTAIACSNLPEGQGTIAYTFNGVTAAAQTIRIVPHNPTIFTISQTGRGPGVVTHPDNRVVTPWEPLHPGDVFVVWFQGGGPSSNDREPTPGDRRSELAPRLVLGEQDVALDYYGGSGCCAGLWQLAARVPAEPVTGCFVPLHLNQGDSWSNNITVAVAPAGQSVCSDTHNFDAASVDLLRANPFLVFSAIFGGYSTTQLPFGGLDAPLADALGFYALTGLAYTPASFLLGPQPNAIGSCQVRALLRNSADPYDPQFVAVQGGAGLLLTLDDGSSTNVQTGYDPQIGGVVSQIVPAPTYSRVRSVRVNDAQYATQIGRFNLTGGLTITALPAPRIDRDQVRREILDTLFRGGQAPRETPLRVALLEPVPENLLLNVQVGVSAGGVDHVAECYFRGGASEYRLPVRLFADVPDSATGATGVFSAQIVQPGRGRAVIAQGAEVRTSAESVVSIAVTR